MKRAAILLLLVVLMSRAACAADLVEGRAFVIDGDTIKINDERIRLHGIDAPEIS
jgi:endonuclease YncB( thermonuclease family)